MNESNVVDDLNIAYSLLGAKEVEIAKLRGRNRMLEAALREIEEKLKQPQPENYE